MPEKRGCGLDLSQDVMSLYLRKSSDIELMRLIDDLTALLDDRKYSRGLKRRQDDDGDDGDDDDEKGEFIYFVEIVYIKLCFLFVNR